MTTRTAVLFGAGASADAGLPLTYELAERVISRANGPRFLGRRDSWVRALNFAYGSMVEYQSKDGGNPLGAVNIERLISALRLLRNAQDHEVAPFVLSWKAGALGFGGTNIDGSLGSTAITALNKQRGGRGFFAEQEFADAIGHIARAATTPHGSKAFDEAEEHILGLLTELLDDLKSVDYLNPLANLARTQTGGLDVLTLNYDLSVETMAAQADQAIYRGVESWRSGQSITFPAKDGVLNLIKLHGSLDWQLKRNFGPFEQSSIEVTPVIKHDVAHPFSPLPNPWIVVGDRDKLATDGPTLALLRAADEALERATNLVVAGYSFGDHHINSLLQSWLVSKPERTITVLDLHWLAPDDFRRDLITKLGADGRTQRNSRVVPLSGKVADKLEEALWARPAPVPSPYIQNVSSQVVDGVRRTQIRLIGPDLLKCSISVYEERPMYGGELHLSPVSTYSDFNSAANPPQSQFQQAEASYDRWVMGTNVTIYTADAESAVREVRVSASRPDARSTMSFSLSV
jgi:hypothetical protein